MENNNLFSFFNVVFDDGNSALCLDCLQQIESIESTEALVQNVRKCIILLVMIAQPVKTIVNLFAYTGIHTDEAAVIVIVGRKHPAMERSAFHHLFVERLFHDGGIHICARFVQLVVTHTIAEILDVELLFPVGAVIPLLFHGAVVAVIEQVAVGIVQVIDILERRCGQEKNFRFGAFLVQFFFLSAELIVFVVCLVVGIFLVLDGLSQLCQGFSRFQHPIGKSGFQFVQFVSFIGNIFVFFSVFIFKVSIESIIVGGHGSYGVQGLCRFGFCTAHQFVAFVTNNQVPIPLGNFLVLTSIGISGGNGAFPAVRGILQPGQLDVEALFSRFFPAFQNIVRGCQDNDVLFSCIIKALYNAHAGVGFPRTGAIGKHHAIGFFQTALSQHNIVDLLRRKHWKRFLQFIQFLVVLFFLSFGYRVFMLGSVFNRFNKLFRSFSSIIGSSCVAICNASW